MGTEKYEEVEEEPMDNSTEILQYIEEIERYIEKIKEALKGT